ncbi:AMP-binding protein, partial [Vibrio parahaemolyticus]
MTWKQVDTHINLIASALLALGADVQERIAIFANNCMAWSLADLAILQLRGVSVPLYATNTPAQAAFIINDADIRILFVGEQAQLDAAIALRGV